MGSIQEIEEAVLKLSPEELAAFRAWFAEFEAATWDEQIERDVAAGRLDRLAEKPSRMCARAAVRIVDTSRHSAVLALLSPIAGEGPTTRR